MATKFSEFTTGATTANTFVVGYDSVADTNNQYSLAQLKTGLEISNIYDADGELAALRTVTHNNNSLVWDMGTGQQFFTTSSTTGTWLNFRIAGAQKGAILATSGGGSMYFRNSGGSDYFNVTQTGTIIATNLTVGGQAHTELHAQATNNLTFNWDNGNVQTTTALTGSHTFTASNPKAGATYIISLAQTGTVTATWTGVKWPAATAPTLSGAGKTDVVTLICYDATGAGLYYGAATLDLA